MIKELEELIKLTVVDADLLLTEFEETIDSGVLDKSDKYQAQYEKELKVLQEYLILLNNCNKMSQDVKSVLMKEFDKVSMEYVDKIPKSWVYRRPKLVKLLDVTMIVAKGL